MTSCATSDFLSVNLHQPSQLCQPCQCVKSPSPILSSKSTKFLLPFHQISYPFSPNLPPHPPNFCLTKYRGFSRRICSCWDFWETFERLLRDFWETLERLWRGFWETETEEWPGQHSQFLRCFFLYYQIKILWTHLLINKLTGLQMFTTSGHIL